MRSGRQKTNYAVRQEILKQLCVRLQKYTRNAKMAPDVIVITTSHTALFKAQNKRASEWLHRHCHLTAENMSGDTEICVHPVRCKKIMEELKAAGFTVTG
jgi:hypothetical protein